MSRARACRAGRGGGGRTPPPGAMLRWISAAVTTALTALTWPKVSDAHPTLIPSSQCGDAAHPTTKHHHAAPVHDGSISFLLSWAAPDGGADPQPDENQPRRSVPQASGKSE